jgi:hypothetical protein
MKSNVLNIIILISVLILLSIFSPGCLNIVSNTPSNSTSSYIPNGPTIGWIIIENTAETTKDCTPALNIYSEGADYMSFSGNGKTWTDWIEYNTFYEDFNIVNNLYGTVLSSGTKYVYVRFKDEEGNLSPSDELAFDAIEYELGELYFIKISPQEIIIPVNGSYVFTLHGYDYGAKNEVPLDNSKVIWTKCCIEGNLSPTTGLSTSYTAPSIPGKRDISAQYNNLKTGAAIIVIGGD